MPIAYSFCLKDTTLHVCRQNSDPSHPRLEQNDPEVKVQSQGAEGVDGCQFTGQEARR